MVDMLKGHKSTVYCVDYANDGENIIDNPLICVILDLLYRDPVIYGPVG